MLDLAERGYLLYDGDCGVCEELAEWARRLDRRGRFFVRPFQDFGEADLQAHGMSYADCERGIQVLTQKDRVYRGAFGVNRFLVSYFPWALLVFTLYLVPVLLLLELVAYRQFAKHRHHVSRWLGLTACKVPTPPNG